MLFPVSSYYSDNIVDGITLTRGGGWWTAVLLIEDPKSGHNIINIYTWQQIGDTWKTRKTFSIKKLDVLTKLLDAFQEFGPKLP